jgi:hypothetical protein
MTSIRQSSRCAAFAALLLFLAFLSQSRLLAGEVTASGDTEWLKMVAAAKKEGKVNVLVYQRENIEAAVKAFEKRHRKFKSPRRARRRRRPARA